MRLGMFAAALGHVALIAPAVIQRSAGRTALEVLAALGTMALPVLADLTALIAHRHTDAGAMSAGALAAAAQITLGMIRGAPGLAGQRIHARTMVGVAAGRIVAAEAAVAPEQTALETGGMLARILAQIRHIAAAHFRITEVFSRLFALLVLRSCIAILAHYLGRMSAFARKVSFYAAGRRDMTLAIGDTVAEAAVRHSVIALASRVAFNSAGSSNVLLAVAVKMPPHAAGSARMVESITIEMTRDPAGLRTIVLLSIPLGVFWIAACRLAAIIRSHRAGRSAQQQAQHQQRRNQLFHHVFFLLFRLCLSLTKTIDLLLFIIYPPESFCQFFPLFSV